jgi:hypothetical protein
MQVLFERKKTPVPGTCLGGWAGVSCYLIFYPLELLHFLHKTEMLSKVLSPPLAMDKI